MTETSFYAVICGQTGAICQTWDECFKQMNGFQNATYEKFDDLKSAEDFLRKHQDCPKDKNEVPALYVKDKPKDNTIDMETYEFLERWARVVPTLSLPPKPTSDQSCPNTLMTKKPPLNSVYIDGYCQPDQTNRRQLRAGIGIFWGVDHHLNVSEPVTGRQAETTAAIHAAIKAAKQVATLGLQEINFHTRSEYLYKSMTEWIFKWKQNDWKTVRNQAVKNKSDFEQLELALQGIQVNWFIASPENEAVKLARNGAYSVSK